MPGRHGDDLGGGVDPPGAERAAGERPAASGQEFRAMMGDFPSGVAVVTAVDGQGTPRGLTCTSLCSLSLAPPALLVCLEHRSGTLGAVAEGGVFAVNLLHAAGRPTAEVFATPGPDRFARVTWKPTELHGLPGLVHDAHTVAECRVTRLVPAGDHHVVHGLVERIARYSGQAPLLYGQRRFTHWPPAAEPTGH